METPDIIILSHIAFDKYCEERNLTDSNIEDQKDFAFISIIGTPEVLEYYLKEPHTYHWFKKDHPNVLNLEFDDVSEDREFKFTNGFGEDKITHAYCMTEEQAQKCVEFFENNIGKTFIIHCRAGMSRSVAVGRILCDFYPEYKNCKGKDYINRMYPNVGVTSVLRRIIYDKNEKI